MRLCSNRAELVQCRRLCNEVASNFFATKAPGPYHWILTSCSGVFRNVWVLLLPFCYCMKLGANQAELVQLMQKFMQRSRVGIFRNEGTWFIPLDPKLMFLCVSWWFGCIWTILLLHKTRCKFGRTGAIKAEVRATKWRRNFSQRRHSIHTIGS